MVDCPDSDRLTTYLLGSLATDEAAAVSKHVDECDACRATVAELLRSSLLGPSGESAPLAVGDRVGRYEIVRHVGEGGTGVVYAARDPQLERDVALKLLRSTMPADAATQDVLRREARTMARLAHPNLTTVHDVGDHEGRVFIAMELLPMTLRRWLATARRPSEIIEVLAGAGRGLHAAHTAGLVHRDFKPDNVLVSDTTIAKVTDFGLASYASSHRVGTPAYMAPEQLRGEPVDARADQFSFCVTLHEALWGVRPFDDDTIRALCSQRSVELRLHDVARPGVSNRVRAAILRGLRADPAQRHESMEHLLHALVPQRSMRWLVAQGVLVASVSVVAATALLHKPRCPAVQPTALLEGRAPLPASAVSAALTSIFTRYSVAWAAAREDACEATEVRGEQSALLLDARMRCLDDRALETRALWDRLASNPTTQLRAAGQADALLPDLHECADVRALGALAPPPSDPEPRARWTEAHALLADARARYDAGEYEAASRAAVQTVAMAQRSGHAPTVASALLLQGKALAMFSRPVEAATALDAAARVADEARDDRTRAAALIRLVFVRQQRGDAQALEDASKQARSVVARLAYADDVVCELESVQAAVDYYGGRSKEAVEHARRALTAGERAFGPDSARLLSPLNNEAAALVNLGRQKEAVAVFDRAIKLSRTVRGAEDGVTAQLEANESTLLDASGRCEEALVTLDHALPILMKTFGAGSQAVESAWTSRAWCQRSLKRWAASLTSMDEALAISLSLHGAAHTDQVLLRVRRAESLRELHRYAEADAELGRALSGAAAVRGTSQEAELVGERALLAEARGDYAGARKQLEVAQRLATKLGSGTLLAKQDAMFGWIALEEAKPHDAERAFSSAISRWKASPDPQVPYEVAARVGLAKAKLALADAQGAIDTLEPAMKVATGEDRAACEKTLVAARRLATGSGSPLPSDR